MLEGLYTYTNDIEGDSLTNFKVRLNSEHPLFKGHFPSKPVLPGVAQVALLRELASKMLHRTLSCTAIREVKFLSPILPLEQQELWVNLTLKVNENQSYAVVGEINTMTERTMKIKATFE